MSLTITALSVGRVFGLQRPSFTYLRGWGETVDIPLIMYVIEGGPDGPIIVDTGADLDRAEKHHHIKMQQAHEERPDIAVRSLGIEPHDVRMVINTHLHWDHSSNNHLFPNARIVVQEDEVEFARSPVSWHRRQFEALGNLQPSWKRAEQQITTVSGDTKLFPGLALVALPGHTPGSQGVLVDAASTRYLIAGDCVYLYENWEGDDEVPHIPSGIYTDLPAFEMSLQRIETFNCEVIPSHDQRVVERRTFD